MSSTKTKSAAKRSERGWMEGRRKTKGDLWLGCCVCEGQKKKLGSLISFVKFLMLIWIYITASSNAVWDFTARHDKNNWYFINFYGCFHFMHHLCSLTHIRHMNNDDVKASVKMTCENLVVTCNCQAHSSLIHSLARSQDVRKSGDNKPLKRSAHSLSLS